MADATREARREARRDTAREGAREAAPAGMRPAGMREEVREGLSREQKELPPKYFYDERGSHLFEEITRLPEYYPTRAELELLGGFAPALVERLRPRTLVELGPGGPEKAGRILGAMHARGVAERYVPVDVSQTYLDALTTALRREHPGLRVEGVKADISADFALPDTLPRPLLLAFLGSTIGNFKLREAVALLRRAAAALHPGDLFLMGADLKKDRATLERAYNDARGVTAEFNLNVLRVLNRRLGADFRLDNFRHHAFYDEEEGRIEMHLVARRPVTVRVPGAGSFAFRAGESIRTEVSHKYDRAQIEALFEAAGLRVAEWVEKEGVFALVAGERR